jgi:dihydroorotase
MADVGLPLLIHGEVTDPTVDIFDREKIFIESILEPLIIQQFPGLKIVLEHIATKDAVDFILNTSHASIAATITAHHLLYNRNALFTGGICPHMYCLPILKREEHRQALLQAATSGNPHFFLGTDSAPHSITAKESNCGCAGIFTGHAPIELYLESFESMNALDKVEGFACRFGQAFYGLPVSTKKVVYTKHSWTVPESYAFGNQVVHPLRAGEVIQWKKVETIE